MNSRSLKIFQPCSCKVRLLVNAGGALEEGQLCRIAELQNCNRDVLPPTPLPQQSSCQVCVSSLEWICCQFNMVKEEKRSKENEGVIKRNSHIHTLLLPNVKTAFPPSQCCWWKMLVDYKEEKGEGGKENC